MPDLPPLRVMESILRARVLAARLAVPFVLLLGTGGFVGETPAAARANAKRALIIAIADYGTPPNH